VAGPVVNLESATGQANSGPLRRWETIRHTHRDSGLLARQIRPRRGGDADDGDSGIKLELLKVPC
jgi:hypothetical protein